MSGIIHIAYKLLVNDRAKYAALLVGITFAVFLMIEMTSLFAGILARSSATVINLGASMWVMDPAVQTVANTIPMPDYVQDEVRSIPGVEYAVPLYSGGALLKLRDGVYQAVNVIGLDDTSLFGRPSLLGGKIEDIFAENSFIAVKDAEFGKLENPKIGTEFELNNHRGVIVGIAHVASSGLFGVPTLYTTYNRARQYIPQTNFTISYLLVEPKTAADVALIKQQVAAAGYLALTKEEFVKKIADSYKYQTGIGTNMLIMTVISFIIGLSISGQKFYTFVLENLEKFGALKATVPRGAS
jgi:putative ABC transport system permease protein